MLFGLMFLSTFFSNSGEVLILTYSAGAENARFPLEFDVFEAVAGVLGLA
jgi:hypothetical protein